MTRLVPLSLSIAIIAAAPALSGDVPFAVPPLPSPGQNGAPVASLSEIMGKIQVRHIKLWYAIKYQNWGLLDYELDQIKDSFNNAVILYRNIPIEFIAAADEPLAALQKAAKLKDGSKLERDFEGLTAACNSCHKAADVGFIVIKTPTSFAFSNQEATPKGK